MFTKIIITILALTTASMVTFSQEGKGIVDSMESSIKDIREELVKIKDNYYVIKPYGIAGNVGVYVNEDNVILVDDQWSILSHRIKEMLKTISGKPIKYIINTHFHYDHSDGNRAFGKEGIPIVSHQNTLSRLSTDQVLPRTGVQKALTPEGLPTVTFTENMSFTEKGETIELIHVKNAHTDGDVFVHFKKGNIYHTGDVFVRYGLPFIDENSGGDIYGMIDAMDYLIAAANENTRFVPGHGEVCGVAELKEYRGLLASIRDQVKEMVRQKKTLADIIAGVTISINHSPTNKEIFISKVQAMVLKHEQ